MCIRDRLHTFLLDKTTVIKKNIYFFVTPLLTRATISISTKGKNEYIEIPPTRRPIGINPTLDISHIYTLLYHEKELGFHFRGEKHNFWELTYVDKGNMYNAVSYTHLDVYKRQGNMRTDKATAAGY